MVGDLIAGVPFLWGYWTGEVALDSSMLERWEGKVLLISFVSSSFTKSFFGGADWCGEFGGYAFNPTQPLHRHAGCSSAHLAVERGVMARLALGLP